jgi:hypothetical protein
LSGSKTKAPGFAGGYLLHTDPKNADLIHPYIGGEEVNDSFGHEPRRFAIDFFDRDLADASRWPQLLEIVRTKVKPLRDRQKRGTYLPFLWRPEAHMFLKPEITTEFAARVGHRLADDYEPPSGGSRTVSLIEDGRNSTSASRG